MFKWLTGQARGCWARRRRRPWAHHRRSPPLPPHPAAPQEAAPPPLAANPVFQRLRAHVKRLTDQHHSVPHAAGEAPKEWVRGWTDSGKELAGGPAARGDS